MRTRLPIFTIMIALLLAVFAAPAQAKQPLRGEMDLQFNLAWLAVGPSTDVPDWVGTITFDGDSHVYGMAFFNTGSGKPFAASPSGNVFFEETWVIYDELTFAFDGAGELDVFAPGAIVLSGYDSGVSILTNATYRMNGYVHTANGDFAEWLGRQVHMSGGFTFYDFGAPQYAPGDFRIN